jgi:putative phosphoribosyl transferase
MSAYTFPNRTEAGRVLARELSHYAGRNDVVVLALPRGGLPVAFEIAHTLHAPLDVFLVRKLGAPHYEELAMGAIASGGVRVLNETVVNQLRITPDQIDEVAQREAAELGRRERAFRDDRPPVLVGNRICILVDDGLATGSTMRAAVMALKRQKPARIIVTAPVASADTCCEFQSLVDEVVCPYTPEPFTAVGCWYDDFTQTTDEEVRDYLEQARLEMAH